MVDVMEDRAIDPAASVMQGELVCGYLDSAGKLHSQFWLREMSGNEEDVLAAKGEVQQKLNRVIYNCLERLGELDKAAHADELWAAVQALTTPDRMLLLIRLREVTFGKLFKMQFTCPQCRKVNRISVDLSALETKPMQDPMVRQRADTLPDGTLVKWHIMTGADEEWLASWAKKREEDRLTLAMIARIDELAGHPFKREDTRSRNAAMALLKGLPMRTRVSIRQLFRNHEGSIDTDLEYECPSCGREIEGDLEVGQADFFFPQEL